MPGHPSLSLRSEVGRSQRSAAGLSPWSPPTEATMQLPLFGYTVYVVLRVSNLVRPGPVLLGLNRQHLVLMDSSSQVGHTPVLVQTGAPGSFLSHHSWLLASTSAPICSICYHRKSAAPSA